VDNHHTASLLLAISPHNLTKVFPFIQFDFPYFCSVLPSKYLQPNNLTMQISLPILLLIAGLASVNGAALPQKEKTPANNPAPSASKLSETNAPARPSDSPKGSKPEEKTDPANNGECVPIKKDTKGTSLLFPKSPHPHSNALSNTIQDVRTERRTRKQRRRS
jgi:hypothetical protein